MTFYLKHPTGMSHLHIIENCINERLTCYRRIKKGNFEMSSFPYLPDDPLDCTGHYFLRLAAVASRSRSFRHYFMSSESKLLEARLSSYDRPNLEQFLRKLLQQTRESFNTCDNPTLRKLYSLFIKIFLFMLRSAYLDHIFNSEQCQGCQKFMIKAVSFQVCLSMVAEKEVKLTSGFAEIPCNMWKKFLVSLFQTYLRNILEIMMSRYPDIEDTRIKNILEMVKKYNAEKNSMNYSDVNANLSLDNVIDESVFFPLCMMNLLMELQKSNRLPHDDRVEFALFLKSVGMTLPNSLEFWKYFYSKKAGACSSCAHSWQRNEKRYVYSVRYMYGLEGAMKNQETKDCTYLQKKHVAPREKGGCPFKTLDEDSLRKMLRPIFHTTPDVIDVIICERNENPNTACKTFLESQYNVLSKEELDNNVEFSDPAEFYLKLKAELGAELS